MSVSSIVFDGIMVTNKSKIISSSWGIVSYIRTIILLGLTTKKTLPMRQASFCSRST